MNAILEELLVIVIPCVQFHHRYLLDSISRHHASSIADTFSVASNEIRSRDFSAAGHVPLGGEPVATGENC